MKPVVAVPWPVALVVWTFKIVLFVCAATLVLGALVIVGAVALIGSIASKPELSAWASRSSTQIAAGFDRMFKTGGAHS